jgi:tight adherence protein C
MTALVLGGSWATLALAVAVHLRPVPARRLRTADVRRRDRLPARIGAAVLRRSGRSPVDPLLAERVGTAVLLACPLLIVQPLAVVPAVLAGWALPGVRFRKQARARQAAVDASLPEVVDLLILATGAGLSVRQAVSSVAARADGPLAAELLRVVADADRGRRLADALEELPARAGESTRALVAVLLASERYGAAVAPGLERLADEVRADTRRRAEAAARRVPVKLLFPLVTCILPAFGLLTVAPLIAGALRSLRL